VLLGFAEALYLPAAIALIADHHPGDTRATAISIHTSGLSFGLVAGGTATGYLGESFGWRPAFLILGGAGLLMAVAAWWWVRDAAEPRELSSRESPSMAASMVYLLRIPSYSILMAQAMLVAVANWIFVNWLPLYFKEVHSMSLGAAGFTGTFVIQGAATVGVLAGGVISDRYAGSRRPRRRMLIQSVCCFLAAPFLLAFLYQPGIAVLNLCIFVCAFFKRVGSTNELPIVCDLLEPRMRSTAIGMMNATNCASGGFGILMAGALKSSLGLDGIFGGLSLLMVLAGAIMLAGYLYFFERDLRLSATGRRHLPVTVPATQAN
jgi:predicted MFS family arabinose efflux permease